MMNITEAIGVELGVEVSTFLKKTPEIQVYANTNINRYQWVDSRSEETCDVWENEDYGTRGTMRTALLTYLTEKGDITKNNE